MITREDIRELAQFHSNGDHSQTVSFYFKPTRPQDNSHRAEAIMVKELVRNAMRSENGKNGLRSDLERIQALGEAMHGNQARAKAVFACHARNFWKEFDLPAQLSTSQLSVGSRFQLRPLAELLGAQPRVWVALTDRQKARFFDLRLDEMNERTGLFRVPAVRQGSSDGYGGYEGGHAQRRVQDEALHHFKEVAEHLRSSLEQGLFDRLIIGCHDSNWHDLEAQLHPYVRKALLGHFSAEVGKMTNEQTHEQANRVLQESLGQRRRELVREVLDQAKSNNRGVTGLRRVLRSLELGEVQTLLVGENFAHAAVECTGCGHIDGHIVRYCPACGRETRDVSDVSDAIIPMAIRRDIELFYVKDDQEFDSAGNIAALLRFRADQSKGTALRVAS